MTERIGTVEHRRRLGAQRPERPSSSKQIADERLAGGNQLVGEYVPRSGFELPLAELSTQLGGPVGTDRQIILEQNGLAIEQECAAR
jgi:hypothetical protein